MLVPHRAENAQLGLAWHPPDDFQKALIFLRFHPMRRDQDVGDCRVRHDRFLMGSALAGALRKSRAKGKGKGGVFQAVLRPNPSALKFFAEL